jgi:hypothetical protein
MTEWPPIDEPELLRLVALDDAGFMAFIRGVIERLPSRECDEAAIARAIAYPWERPLGSYLLGGDGSRFGAFCPDGEPVALAAIPAAGRTAPELSEERLLDRAARLAVGPAADAETLIRAIFERPGETAERVAATVHKAALPFSSPGWTPFGSEPERG